VKRIRLCLSVLLALSGCRGADGSFPARISDTVAHFFLTEFRGAITEPDGLVKSGVACLSYPSHWGKPVGPVESTPIVWEGQVLLVTGNSHHGATDGSLRIDTFGCTRNIARVSVPGLHYISAFTQNHTVFVFGASGKGLLGSSGKPAIQMLSSRDLVHWSKPVSVLYAPPDVLFFNTSVTRDASGYLMAIESLDKAYGPTFLVHFARSADLLSWKLIPPAFVDTPVANDPWLRFDPRDGFYYTIYGNWRAGQQLALVARSRDLKNWQKSPRAAFSPDWGEGSSTAQVSAAEKDGWVYFGYARGDQTQWLETSTAKWRGTLHNYLKSFFD
jgi:hypothetical protein